ncbi:MAG: 4Fe-4S dicluster domain-containing protein, partial [Oscillospiraceae bacterium]|nr:4Fe-4S dicluster domain-containing protein [Oscillospiraceae bacterium]
GLAGGLLSNAKACSAFMNTYDNVVPIWGIQTLDQVNEWLSDEVVHAQLNEALNAVISADRQQLAGSFCRSCGYCMPCPVGIDIRNAARMDMLLRRAVWQNYCTDEWYAKMQKINDCLECRQCASRCPYELDTPNVLKYMLKDYNEFYETHKHLL